MVHHAVVNPANDVVVAEAARLLGNAEVARIHEPDEVRGFVIKPDVGVRRISGCFPKLFVPWQDMSLLYR